MISEIFNLAFWVALGVCIVLGGNTFRINARTRESLADTLTLMNMRLDQAAEMRKSSHTLSIAGAVMNTVGGVVIGVFVTRIILVLVGAA